MTAINAFTDHDYAYLATDGAAYNCDTGVMVAECLKVAMFSTLSLAVAVAGRAPIGMFVDSINRVHSLLDDPTQASILASLVPAMRECRVKLASSKVDERSGRNVIIVIVAIYDHALKQPRLMRAYSDGAPGEADAGAYQLQEVDGWSMPALSTGEEAVVFPAGYTIAPEQEMAAMLSIQRRKAVPQVHGGRAVGGTCFFYRVGRDGVHGQQLLSFGDTVGQPIGAHECTSA